MRCSFVSLWVLWDKSGTPVPFKTYAAQTWLLVTLEGPQRLAEYNTDATAAGRTGAISQIPNSYSRQGPYSNIPKANCRIIRSKAFKCFPYILNNLAFLSTIFGVFGCRQQHVSEASIVLFCIDLCIQEK